MSKFIPVLLLSGMAVASAQTPAPDPNAILAAARTALGGEPKLSGVKTIVATGRTRQVAGDNLVPIEFEIAIELPSKYARKDEVPARESGPTLVGFNGETLVQEPPNAGPPQGRPGGPPPPTPEQLAAANRARVVGVKQDFARLMLGLFAGSFDAYPLTFSYVGQAEAPQGAADVLEAKGAPNFTMRFFVYRDTHLPVMVTWTGGPAGGRGGPGPGRGAAPPGRGAPADGARGAAPDAGRGATPDAARGAPDAARGATPDGGRGAAPPAGPGAPTTPAGAGAPPPPPENRLYFADYRDVDGMKFPFRLRRAVGQDTIEETTFDRFRINSKIDAKKFEVRK